MSVEGIQSHLNQPLGDVIQIENDASDTETREAVSKSASLYLLELEKGLFGWPDNLRLLF